VIQIDVAQIIAFRSDENELTLPAVAPREIAETEQRLQAAQGWSKTTEKPATDRLDEAH